MKADAIVITTEWPEFQNIDWENIANLMSKPAWVFDTRGIINRENLSSYNINFWEVGTSTTI